MAEHAVLRQLPAPVSQLVVRIAGEDVAPERVTECDEVFFARAPDEATALERVAPPEGLQLLLEARVVDHLYRRTDDPSKHGLEAVRGAGIVEHAARDDDSARVKVLDDRIVRRHPERCTFRADPIGAVALRLEPNDEAGGPPALDDDVPRQGTRHPPCWSLGGSSRPKQSPGR